MLCVERCSFRLLSDANRQIGDDSDSVSKPTISDESSDTKALATSLPYVTEQDRYWIIQILFSFVTHIYTSSIESISNRGSIPLNRTHPLN